MIPSDLRTMVHWVNLFFLQHLRCPFHLHPISTGVIVGAAVGGAVAAAAVAVIVKKVFFSPPAVRTSDNLNTYVSMDSAINMEQL